MQRVAALFLSNWPIDRLRQAERRAAPPEPRAPISQGVSFEPLREAVAREQEHVCSVPRGGGWRPGARWAREDRLGKIALPPAHRQPARHEVGRRDEAASHPFKAMPPDEAGPFRAMGRDQALPDRDEARRLSSGKTPPLITTIRAKNRIEIAAACPVALRLGVRPGMPLAQVRAQTPGLDIRRADPEGDRAALQELALALARRWSPTVAIAGDDTLFIDLTGVAHLHGGEAAMARRLRRMLARLGFASAVAIADTPAAAWALAHHAGSTICPTGTHAQAIAPLPIEALRIEPRAVELLHRLGVTRVAQLAVMPRAPLAKRFGKSLVLRLEQALGRLPEPLNPVVPREAILAAQRFAEPIATPEAIAHWLAQIVVRLAAALEAQGLGATRIELIADRIDGVPQRIRAGLARPSRDAAHLLRLLTRRIEEIEPGFGIDALALHVRRADVLAPQPVTERLDEEGVPDLAILIDTLATRIGMAAMWRTRPVESDVPERSLARAGVIDPPERGVLRGKQDDVRQLDRNLALVPWHPEWPRPARLLRRPEALDHVVAELPDHAPRRFTWRGTSHRVIRADGPERVHGEWWKRASEAQSVRDYFRVEDESGRRYWLFRAGDGERTATGDLSWYLHGVFG